MSVRRDELRARKEIRMFDNHRYRPAWLLVTALAAIVGGCEVKRSLDVERVESSIQAGIEEQLDVEVKRVR